MGKELDYFIHKVCNYVCNDAKIFVCQLWSGPGQQDCTLALNYCPASCYHTVIKQQDGQAQYKVKAAETTTV